MYKESSSKENDSTFTFPEALSLHDQENCLVPPQSSVTLGHCEYNWDINLVDQDLIGS